MRSFRVNFTRKNSPVSKRRVYSIRSHDTSFLYLLFYSYLHSTPIWLCHAATASDIRSRLLSACFSYIPSKRPFSVS